jgi:hypothetical protein
LLRCNTTPCLATWCNSLRHCTAGCNITFRAQTIKLADTNATQDTMAGWDGTCCMSEFAWPRRRCCCCAAEATDMSCAAATLVHRWTTHALRVPIHNVSPSRNGRAFSDTASTGRLGRIISASSAHYWKILHEALPACGRRRSSAAPPARPPGTIATVSASATRRRT